MPWGIIFEVLGSAAALGALGGVMMLRRARRRRTWETINTSLENLTDKLQIQTTKSLSDLADQNEKISRILSSEQQRYMDYFWNDKKKEIRNEIGLLIIHFFETDGLNRNVNDIVSLRISAMMYGLRAKNYINIHQFQNQEVYSLTPLGVVYIKDKHPKLIIIWENILERKLLVFIYATMTFAATVFALWDGIGKILRW